jgi:diguanylate cyclase (GGDEF)-like protein
MVMRALAALTQPPQADFMAPNPVHAVPYLVFACVAVAATLGVFWMVVQLLERDLVRLANRDALTGMLNRPAFLAEFEREISRSRRGGERFSLAVFDLDRFKDLNDRFGHAAGDRVLQLAAAAMRQCLRGHDVLARYGGEEFALLMPAADKDTGLRIAERIRAAVEALAFQPSSERVALSVSGGVATRDEDGADWEALFAAADGALYAAKNAGRNRIVAA